MTKGWFSERKWLLILGDAAVIALVTLFGFERHPEAVQTVSRKLTTFLPFFAAWMLVSPHLGVFDIHVLSDGRRLWRPFWAMVLAAPFAALIRGVWLGTTIQPVFVVVVGGISSLGLLIWRTVYWIFSRQESVGDG